MLDTQESEVVMSSADAEHIANMSEKMSIAKAAYDEKRALEVEERSRMKQDNKALRMRVKELREVVTRYKRVMCKGCCGDHCTCEQTLEIDAILNNETPPEAT